jgi:hypothetical protein
VQEARQLAKNSERDNHIREGAHSGSLEHMCVFVEKLLEYNQELHGSDYEMKDKVTTNHVLNALADRLQR